MPARACDEIDRQRRRKRRRRDPEQEGVAPRVRKNIRERVGGGRLADRVGQGGKGPAALGLRFAAGKLAHPAEDQRDVPGQEGADDDARHADHHRIGGDGEPPDAERLDREGEAQRRPEADAVAEHAREHRAGKRAKTEQHPMPRADSDPPPEAAGDEVDQEHHVRHRADGVQGVFEVERPELRVGRGTPAAPAPAPACRRRAASRSRPRG